MKRHLDQESFLSEVTPKSAPESGSIDEKRIKITTEEEVYKFTKIPEDDSMGIIFKLLPLKDLCKCREVCKHWNEIIESERVPLFFAIKTMINFCVESWKDGRNDELYVSLRKWLTGKEESINLSADSPYFMDTVNPLVVDKYPCITIISSTFGWMKFVAYYEIMVHLSDKTKIRMHLHISNTEDEIVYLNVEKNEDPTFDWSSFNIDPNTRNILVHKVEGSGEENSDYEAKTFMHNKTFFERLFGGVEEYFSSPYFKFVKSMLNFGRQDYYDIISVEKDQKCEEAVQYLYLDDLREKLIQQPLSKVCDVSKAVGVLEDVVCNIFHSFLNDKDKEEEESSIVFVSDVVGGSYSACFRMNMHFIRSFFKLIVRDKVFDCTMKIRQKFYYGTDGYESKHTFLIENEEIKEKYYINGNSDGIHAVVQWADEENKIVLEKLGLRELFKSVNSFITFIIESALEKLPNIDPFYGIAWESNETLKTYLIGEVND